MIRILKTVWNYSPLYFIPPFIYFMILGVSLLRSAKLNMFSSLAEIIGFSIAFLIFFLIMVIAPILGTYKIAIRCDDK